MPLAEFPRDIAIDTTCSNLIMAGVLPKTELPGILKKLRAMDNRELSLQLLNSRTLYLNALDSSLEFRRN